MRTFIIDIETTGLDKKEDKINLVGILEYNGSEMVQVMNPLDFLEEAKRLDLRHNLCVFHNASFDTGFIEQQWGYKFDNVTDTMILYYLYNPYRQNYSLKSLVNELFRYKYDVSLDIKTGVSQQMRQYNLIDLQMTGLLYQFTMERLTEKEVRLAKFLTKAAAIYDKISERGVLIDTSYCKKKLKEVLEETEKLETYIKKQTGDINLNSSQQLAKVLFNKLGYKPVRRTEKGQWAVSSDVLITYETDLSKALLRYKALTKLANSFLIPYSTEKVIHPRFWVTSTKTGRTSSSKPNLQQIPRGPVVRNMLKVPSSEWIFAEIDYSQMELRCAGHIANVKDIITAYREDKDIHTQTAQMISGKEDITSEDRNKAKAVNFGFMYGMGAEAFVHQAKAQYGVTVTLEEAKQFRDKYFEQYPELLDYYKSIERDMKELGYIENPIGRRRRRFGKGQEQDRGSFINAKIQGFASDVLLLSLIEISELPEYDVAFQVIGTVHDSILMYVRKDMIAVLDKIKSIMENPKYVREMMDESFVLPIKADVSMFEKCWYGPEYVPKGE